MRPFLLAERAFGEERRRTKAIPHLHDERNLVHLVFAVLMRANQKWNKKSSSAPEQQQIRRLRQQRSLDEQGVSFEEPLSEPPTHRSATSAASPGLQGLGDLTRRPCRHSLAVATH